MAMQTKLGEWRWAERIRKAIAEATLCAKANTGSASIWRKGDAVVCPPEGWEIMARAMERLMPTIRAEALRIAAAEAAALREMAIVEARELLHMELVAGRMTEEES